MPIHVLSTNATTTNGTVMAYNRSMTNTIWAQGNGKGVSEIALQQSYVDNQPLMQNSNKETWLMLYYECVSCEILSV